MTSELVIKFAELWLHVKECNLKEVTVDDILDVCKIKKNHRNNFAVGCIIKQASELIET